MGIYKCRRMWGDSEAASDARVSPTSRRRRQYLELKWSIQRTFDDVVLVLIVAVNLLSTMSASVSAAASRVNPITFCRQWRMQAEETGWLGSYHPFQISGFAAGCRYSLSCANEIFRHQNLEKFIHHFVTLSFSTGIANLSRWPPSDSVIVWEVMCCSTQSQQFRRQKFLCCWSSCVERLAVISATGHELHKHFTKSLNGLCLGCRQPRRTSTIVVFLRLRSLLTYLLTYLVTLSGA